MPNVIRAASKVHERHLSAMVKSQDLVLRLLEKAVAHNEGRPAPSHQPEILGKAKKTAGALAVQLVANARDRASFQYRFTSEVLAIVAPGESPQPDKQLAEVTTLQASARKS